MLLWLKCYAIIPLITEHYPQTRRHWYDRNGCPPASRLALRKAFIAKAVWDFPTTRDLIDAVRHRPTLRRETATGVRRRTARARNRAGACTKCIWTPLTATFLSVGRLPPPVCRVFTISHRSLRLLLTQASKKQKKRFDPFNSLYTERHLLIFGRKHGQF